MHKRPASSPPDSRAQQAHIARILPSHLRRMPKVVADRPAWMTRQGSFCLPAIVFPPAVGSQDFVDGRMRQQAVDGDDRLFHLTAASKSSVKWQLTKRASRTCLSGAVELATRRRQPSVP